MADNDDDGAVTAFNNLAEVIRTAVCIKSPPDTTYSIGHILAARGKRDATTLQTKLKLIPHGEHYSHIELTIHLHWVREGDQREQRAHVVYRFTSSNVRGRVAIASIEDRSATMASQLQQTYFPHVSAQEIEAWLRDARYRYSLLTIRHQPSRIAASNLFNYNTYHQELDERLTMLRSLLVMPCDTEQTVTCLVVGDGLDAKVTALNQRFASERATSPMEAFYTTPNAHYLQIGQLKPAQERPQYQYGPVDSFQQWDEYYTLQGFAVINEDEAIRDRVKEPFKVHVRVLQPVDTNENVYLGFILRDELGLSLVPSDTMDVSFTKNRSEDLHARVTEAYPHATLGDIAVVLTRRYDKQQQAFQREPALPGGVIRDRFTAEPALRRAIAEAKGIKVQLHITPDKTQTKRRLSALREIQKFAPPELKQLLLANSFFHLRLYDLFETVDAADHQRLVEHFCHGFDPDQMQAMKDMERLHGRVGLVQGPPGAGKTHLITASTAILVFSKPILSPLPIVLPGTGVEYVEPTEGMEEGGKQEEDKEEGGKQEEDKEEEDKEEEDKQEEDKQEEDKQEEDKQEEDKQEGGSHSALDPLQPTEDDLGEDAAEVDTSTAAGAARTLVLGAPANIQPLKQHKTIYWDSEGDDDDDDDVNQEKGGDDKKHKGNKGRNRQRNKPTKPKNLPKPTRQLPQAPTKHQVLIVAPMNVTVDHIASVVRKSFQDYIRQQGPAAEEEEVEEPLIARIHAWNSERKILKGERQDGDDPTAIETMLQDMEALRQTVIQETRLAEETVAHIRESMPTSPTGDVRVRHAEWSLMQQMLRMAGCLDPAADCKYTQRERFASTRNMIRDFAARQDVEWSEQDRKDFGDMLAALRSYTISVLDVVVTTLSNAADYMIHSAFAACAIFVDEAAKAAEADFWSLLIFYPFARGIVMFGDSKQLRPMTERDITNPLDTILGRSLFTRLEKNGFPRTAMRTQHRFNSQINGLVAPVFYNDELIASPSSDNRAATQLVLQFNEATFEKDSTVLFLEVSSGVATRRGSTNSQYNNHNLAATMQLVERLIHAGFPPREIGILCAYEAQYGLYVRAKRHLRRLFPTLPMDELLVQKFDAFQGGERSIIIADLVVTGSYIGFLKEGNRINVALTRAKDALYIVGAAQSIDSNSRSLRKTKLLGVVRYCLSNELVVPVTLDSNVVNRYQQVFKAPNTRVALADITEDDEEDEHEDWQDDQEPEDWQDDQERAGSQDDQERAGSQDGQQHGVAEDGQEHGVAEDGQEYGGVPVDGTKVDDKVHLDLQQGLETQGADP